MISDDDNNGDDDDDDDDNGKKTLSTDCIHNYCTCTVTEQRRL